MRFKAFISYSHAADNLLAPKLQHALQQLAKPFYKLRAISIFRDESSLSSTPELWPTIQKALHESEYFILLASQEAAQSEWVKREVQEWLTIHNESAEKMLIVLTKDNIVWDTKTNDFNWDQTDAIPRRLLENKFRNEPLYIDLRWARTEQELTLKKPRFAGDVATLAATLHGISKDELIGEDIIQHKRFQRISNTTILVLFILLFAAYYLYRQADNQKKEAQTQLALNFWNSSKSALSKNNQFAYLHLIGQAISNSEDQELTKMFLLDVQPSLPMYKKGARLEGSIKELAFSPDGERILTHSGIIQVWEASSGKLLATIENTIEKDKGFNEWGFDGAIFSQDGKRILAWGNYIVGVWEASSGRPLAIIKHVGIVRKAVFSQDECSILSWGEDGLNVFSYSQVQVWEASSGKLLTTIKQEESFEDAMFSPDGKRVLTWDDNDVTIENNQIRVWEASSGKPLATMKQDEDFGGATFSPDGKHILAWGKSSIRVWEMLSGKLLATLKQENAFGGAIFSLDGKRVLTWDEENVTIDIHQVRVWEASSGKPLATMKQDGGITGALFSRDERRILSYGPGGIIIWAQSGQSLTKPLKQEHQFDRVEFTNDKNWILSWIYNDVVQVWEASSGKLLATINPDEDFGGATFSPDGKRVLTWNDNAVQVWETFSGRSLPIVKKEEGFGGATFSPDGKHILIEGREEMQVWKASSSKPLATIKQRNNLYHKSFSPDGKRILAYKYYEDINYNEDGIRDYTENGSLNYNEVWVWEASSGKPLFNKKLEEQIKGVIFSPDGNRILIFYLDVIQVWEVSTRNLIVEIKPESFHFNGAIFSPDGNRILSWFSWGIDTDGQRVSGVNVWEASSGKPLVTIKLKDSIKGVIFSPDGNRILTIDDNIQFENASQLWEASSGKFLATIKQEENFDGAIFSPDGKRILAWNDLTISLWETGNGQPLLKMNHIEGKDLQDVIFYTKGGNLRKNVTGAAFNQEGSYILSWSEDGTIQLWQANTGQAIAKPLQHIADVKGAAFSKDDSRILAWGGRSFSSWNIQADLDFPKDLFIMQVQALTGTALNLKTLAIYFLPSQDLKKIKADYIKLASEHYQECKYRRANLWRRFYPNEAKKIDSH